MIEQYDDKRCYCRKLGHFVPFVYCRQVGEGLPCSRVHDCWFEAIPVREFVRQNYTDQEIEKVLTPSQPKISTILDIVNRVKQKGSA